MVKYVCVLLLVMACAAPAFAQDYPVFEIGLGYANTGGEVNGFIAFDGRHSGFATNQAFNLSSNFAIENYFGYYGLGRDLSFGKMQLLANMIGGRVATRTDRFMLYGTAGIGGGWIRFPDLGAGTQNAFGVRFGGGVDIPLNDSVAWKVEASRMSFHFNLDPAHSWNSGVNIYTGIVLKISQ